jgi:hypothetical protein
VKKSLQTKKILQVSNTEASLRTSTGSSHGTLPRGQCPRLAPKALGAIQRGELGYAIITASKA